MGRRLVRRCRCIRFWSAVAELPLREASGRQEREPDRNPLLLKEPDMKNKLGFTLSRRNLPLVLALARELPEVNRLGSRMSPRLSTSRFSYRHRLSCILGQPSGALTFMFEQDIVTYRVGA
jgi:hypothetical protein